MTTTIKVNATYAYDSKEDLKDNGFSWNKEDKVWTKDFSSMEEYNEFLEHFIDVTYYGRHAVNKYHSKVVFEVIEIADEAEVTEEVETEEQNNTTMNEEYSSMINAIEACNAKVEEVIPAEEGAKLVIFTYGEYKETTAAIIYEDGTIFTLNDWQQGSYPKTIDEVADYKWRLGVTEHMAVICNQLPRILCEDYTYDVCFDDDESSNSKGWSASYQECLDYIHCNNGTNESYFGDYKGGVVSIYCNETDEVMYQEEIK